MYQPKKEYWFKRRRYGIGWIPATWQGWLLTLAPLIVIFGGGMILTATSQSSSHLTGGGGYIISVIIVVIICFLITLRKAPHLKWRWGPKDSDNPDEDA